MYTPFGVARHRSFLGGTVRCLSQFGLCRTEAEAPGSIHHHYSESCLVIGLRRVVCSVTRVEVGHVTTWVGADIGSRDMCVE